MHLKRNLMYSRCSQGRRRKLFEQTPIPGLHAHFQEHNFLVFRVLAYVRVCGPVLVLFWGVIQLLFRVELSQETDSGYPRGAGVALVGSFGSKFLIEN